MFTGTRLVLEHAKNTSQVAAWLLGSFYRWLILTMAHFYTYGVSTVNLGFLVPEVDGVLGRMLSTMLAQGQ